MRSVGEGNELRKVQDAVGGELAAPLPQLRQLTWWFPLVAVLGHFLLYFSWLKVEWEINANYGFGPLIPIAAGVLIYLRLDRWKTPAAPIAVGKFALGSILVSLLLAPIFLLSEVNPDWRLLMWGHALVLFALTAIVLYSLGGWPWLRAGAPVLLLLALAIPWPVRFEQWLLGILLDAISSRAADLFYVIGYSVIQHNNLLYVEGVALGVDEACSGIRSLQLTLVLVVFLLLWRPLSPMRTLILAVGGSFVCLLGNLGRILLLGIIGVRKGSEAIEHWHDMVGAVATTSIVLGILLFRWLVHPVHPRGHREKIPSRFAAFQSSMAWKSRQLANWPLAWSIPFLLTIAVPHFSLWLYYPDAIEGDGEHYRIHFEWDSALPGFEERSIPSAVTEQMRYTKAERFSLGEEGRWSLQGYAFFWEDGRISSFTSVHRPENCLPSIGYQMRERLRPLVLPIEDKVIPLYRYVFELQGREFYVYHAFWDTAKGEDALGRMSAQDRFQAFRDRDRFGPRQAILFMVAGDLNPNQANRIVSEVLQRSHP